MPGPTVSSTLTSTLTLPGVSGLGAAGVSGPGVAPSVVGHGLGSSGCRLGSGSDCGSDAPKTAPVEQNFTFDGCWRCLVEAAQVEIDSEV